MSAVLEVSGLTVTFRSRGARQPITAVRDVGLSVRAGESLGLVGGSGAGKSTIARVICGLVTPDAGRVLLDGEDVLRAPAKQRLRLRQAVHMVFQDPYSSLPPHLRVEAIVAEPLVIGRVGGRGLRAQRVADALRAVRLLPLDRYTAAYPHQLSGGERQRVAMARALVTGPRLILADEPTQMLDASLRAELVDLLGELRSTRSIAVLFITHDLALAQRACDRLMVLQEGRVVEEGPVQRILLEPVHPYTIALVNAARGLHGQNSVASSEEVLCE
ncbi:MAG: ABC transporter ATP-binding protein [Actinomycetota bacterium]